LRIDPSEVTTANGLVEAGIIIAVEVPEEGGRCFAHCPGTTGVRSRPRPEMTSGSHPVVPPTLVTHGPAKPWLSGEQALVYFPQGEINATHTECREVGDELDLLSVVPFADAVIASREEDADTPRTEP
jgi:hypothetical protein